MDCEGNYPEWIKSRGVCNIYISPSNNTISMKNLSYILVYICFIWKLFSKDGSILPTFYQRDDSLTLYEAIRNYVTKYVNLYYGSYIHEFIYLDYCKPIMYR